ncbi:MAG TPA: hypothetical protein VLA98_01025, partial [Solirubrobacteraceae bacterium]|nr:hypothetical protein [Solirubrobacteraceae bacterium]
MTPTATAAPGARALDVAAPVLARRGAGTVRTVTRHAVHVDLGGWVLTVTGPATPALPNALRLRVEPGPLAGPPGAPAVLAPGLLRAGGLVVRWDADAPPAWDPRLPALAQGPALAARGH